MQKRIRKHEEGVVAFTFKLLKNKVKNVKFYISKPS